MIFALDLTHMALRYQVSVEITCYVVTFHVHKHAFYKLYASLQAGGDGLQVSARTGATIPGC